MSDSGFAPAAPPPLVEGDAVFLDFDGTLVDIAERPEAVRISPRLPALLETLRRQLGGGLAIVSGRPLREIDGFLEPLRLPGAGQHGAELRRPGKDAVQTRRSLAVERATEELLMRLGSERGLLVEAKGASVAVHYRTAPQRSDECARIVAAVAEAHGLEVLHGKMVVEARPRGQHKGAAIEALLADPPLKGRRPVFVGDDRTDEDGFETAQARGGFGVKVGGGETIARYRLDDVEAVHTWLRASAERQP